MSMVALIGSGSAQFRPMDKQQQSSTMPVIVVHLAIETWMDNGANSTRLVEFTNMNVRPQLGPFILNTLLLIETVTLLVMRIINKPVGRLMVCRLCYEINFHK
jgi:hypothetical protein